MAGTTFEIRLSILGLAGSMAVRAVVGSQEADAGAIEGAVGWR